MICCIIFIIGYLLIIFGKNLYINKIIPSILMATTCWSIIFLLKIPVYHIVDKHLSLIEQNKLLLLHLGKISEIIFFLIGSMLIVSVIEKFYAFEAIEKIFNINTKRGFLWKLSIISFLLSAIIDNLTTSIVLVSLLKKIIKNYKERLYYIGIIIISSNAGGVWSPIGDITTTMLWISKKVTTINLFKISFLPSLLCMLCSTLITSSLSIFNGKIKKNIHNILSDENFVEGIFMIMIGFLLMIIVPILKYIIDIPPYIGILLSFSILLCIITIKYRKNIDIILLINNIINKIDISSLLFFFGILFSVASLESIGSLYHFSIFITKFIPKWEITALLLGFISSIIDNVPLVSAIISMFPHYIDHYFWHFIAYVSGTGGSLLLIGSASGIAVMSIEKIEFIWYLKKISWIALIGYLIGFIYLIIFNII